MTITAASLLLSTLLSDPLGSVEAGPSAIKPEGRWPNGFAYALVVDPEERWAFAGSGGTILVCSLDRGTTPRPAIAEITTDGFVFSLALAGNDLFAAASRGGFFHADVSDPTKSSAARKIADAEDIAFDIAVRGDLLALADGAAGVLLLERKDDSFVPLTRLAPPPGGRALGVVLGEDFAIVALGEGGVGRIDLRDRSKPSFAVVAKSDGIARSLALAPDGRSVLVGEDTADLTLRDVETLEVRTRREFQLPENRNPGPQRSPKPATPLAVSRVRVFGERAVVGLEGTELPAQISPFTPEFGAWKGEPHYEPRAAVAVVDASNEKLPIVGFCDEPSNRATLSWVKDVALLRNGDVFALDFVNGVFRVRATPDRKRGDGLPGMVEVAYEIDTRAGAIDVEMSPTAKTLLYALSDIGGLQLFDIADPAHLKAVTRVKEGGGTFCAVTTRMEPDPDGSEHPIDYVFINNFFRVGICRIDLRHPERARMLQPLWITLPEAIRGKRAYESLGLTPRSYRVSIEGDWLDVVATNTVFGWQRFSIAKVLASEKIVNIYDGIERPPEYARFCEPEFRAITSPDALTDSKRLVNAPFARAGKSMGLLVDGSRVIVGSGAQRITGGRGGRGGGEPHDGYLQYFDLGDPMVVDPMLGPLRFPRGTTFVKDGDVQIGLALRGAQLFVADTAGLLRTFHIDASASGSAVFTPGSAQFDNQGHYGADSVFDLIVDGDLLHVAGWSAGYLRLWIGNSQEDSKDPRFLSLEARFDSPGLPISLVRTATGRIVVAEHNAGFLVMPAPAHPESR